MCDFCAYRNNPMFGEGIECYKKRLLLAFNSHTIGSIAGKQAHSHILHTLQRSVTHDVSRCFDDFVTHVSKTLSSSLPQSSFTCSHIHIFLVHAELPTVAVRVFIDTRYGLFVFFFLFIAMILLLVGWSISFPFFRLQF